MFVVACTVCRLVGCDDALLLLQRADLEAAQLYDDFVASFGGEEEKKRPQAFVTGGTIQPGSRPTAGWSVLMRVMPLRGFALLCKT